MDDQRSRMGVMLSMRRVMEECRLKKVSCWKEKEERKYPTCELKALCDGRAFRGQAACHSFLTLPLACLFVLSQKMSTMASLPCSFLPRIVVPDRTRL